jgi:hypothetical protein
MTRTQALAVTLTIGLGLTTWGAAAQQTRSATIRLDNGQTVTLLGVQIFRQAVAAQHILGACRGPITLSQVGQSSYFASSLKQASTLPSYDRDEVLAAAKDVSANARSCARYAGALKADPAENVFLAPGRR